jgi:hypothetical protein
MRLSERAGRHVVMTPRPPSPPASPILARCGALMLALLMLALLMLALLMLALLRGV